MEIAGTHRPRATQHVHRNADEVLVAAKGHAALLEVVLCERSAARRDGERGQQHGGRADHQKNQPDAWIPTWSGPTAGSNTAWLRRSGGVLRPSSSASSRGL
jgi:hypothetical protein